MDLAFISANPQSLPELLTLLPNLKPDVNEAPYTKFSVKPLCEVESRKLALQHARVKLKITLERV